MIKKTILFLIILLLSHFLISCQNNNSSTNKNLNSKIAKGNDSIFNYRKVDSLRVYCWCLGWGKENEMYSHCSTYSGINAKRLIQLHSTFTLIGGQEVKVARLIKNLRQYKYFRYSEGVGDQIDIRFCLVMYAGENSDTLSFVTKNVGILNNDIVVHYPENLKTILIDGLGLTTLKPCNENSSLIQLKE